MKFADAEIAIEFQTAFKSGQEEMKILMSGGDAPEKSKEADEAADALASLSVDGTKAESTSSEQVPA